MGTLDPQVLGVLGLHTVVGVISVVLVLFGRRWATAKARRKQGYHARVRVLDPSFLGTLKAKGIEVKDVTSAHLEYIHGQLQQALNKTLDCMDVTVRVIRGCVLLYPSTLYVDSGRPGSPGPSGLGPLSLSQLLPRDLKAKVRSSRSATWDAGQDDGALLVPTPALITSRAPQLLDLVLELNPAVSLPLRTQNHLPAIRPIIWSDLDNAQIEPENVTISRTRASAPGRKAYSLRITMPPLRHVGSLCVQIGVVRTEPDSDNESDDVDVEAEHVAALLPFTLRLPVVPKQIASEIASQGEEFASDYASLIRVLGGGAAAPAFREVARGVVAHCDAAGLSRSCHLMEDLLSQGSAALRGAAVDAQRGALGWLLAAIGRRRAPPRSNRAGSSSHVSAPESPVPAAEPSIEDVTMNRYTLRFSDPSLERTFCERFYLGVLQQHTTLCVFLGAYFHFQYYVEEGRLPPLMDPVNFTTGALLAYLAIWRRNPGPLYPLLATLQAQVGAWARSAQTDKFCLKIGMKDKPYLIFSAALYLAMIVYGLRMTFPWILVNVVAHAAAGIMISTYLPNCSAGGLMTIGINLNTCIGVCIPAFYLYRSERARRLRFLEECKKRSAKVAGGSDLDREHSAKSAGAGPEASMKKDN